MQETAEAASGVWSPPSAPSPANPTLQLFLLLPTIATLLPICSLAFGMTMLMSGILRSAPSKQGEQQRRLLK